MRLSVGRKATLLLAMLSLMALAADTVLTAPPPLPNPVAIYTGPEFYTTGGKHWQRYKFEVVNLEVYPNEMFAPAPDLPPCGSNTKSSRTWVDIYDQSGKRLNGFCALPNRDGLNKLWFALEEGVVPPSWIYIELTDRKTGTKYKSGLVDTVS
ncbi:MAG TPA: hypothetical protein VGC89_22115 [Pyrinomonadaceae bacterium]|jgi:hypothetical protein